ncbi:MAG: hypothetical protein IJ708_01145, partial [Clostridia bacterium]|nr:hypothetical protein [Clostridia bacterium]
RSDKRQPERMRSGCLCLKRVVQLFPEMGQRKTESSLLNCADREKNDKTWRNVVYLGASFPKTRAFANKRKTKFVHSVDMHERLCYIDSVDFSYLQTYFEREDTR